MKRDRVFGSGAILLIFLAALCFPQAPQGNSPQPAPKNSAQAGGNARGQYVVEEVSRCWECHTPMSGQGQWDRSKWLQGAAVWFRPIQPITEWAYSAPRLAGLPSFSDDQARTILEKGIGPNGLAIRLPMHTYHMSPEDSQAVIAYLRSLARK